MDNTWDNVVKALQKIRAFAKQSGVEDELKGLIVKHAEDALSALEAPHDVPATDLEGEASLSTKVEG